ncbi:hypothetical protein [Saccharomonospora saliphila]|uniref:hypothetical protein n=1 Tax=Saccharomonospora saliphila TaxID=369829 RepID=UPI0003752CBB|nr:hypothetical protein [Saccharomonospora saliphila]
MSRPEQGPDERDRDAVRGERDPDQARKRDPGGVSGELNRDVPDPPNKDEIRFGEDVTPDAGTVEPPD